MAITNVRGTVSRVFFDGKGAEVSESREVRGETYTTRWAAFFEQPHGLREGEAVEVSGLHGDKIDEWQDKTDPNVTRRAVKRTLNRARIVTGAGQQGGQETAGDPWAGVSVTRPGNAPQEPAPWDYDYSDSTPF